MASKACVHNNLYQIHTASNIAWTRRVHYTYAYIFVLETRNTASPIILVLFQGVDAGGAGCIVI